MNRMDKNRIERVYVRLPESEADAETDTDKS